MKVVSQFRALYYTNLRSIVRGRSEAVRMTIHRCHSYNFRFQLRQKNVTAYNIAAVCYNGQVQENMLSSNHFTSIQSKSIAKLSEFRVSLQNFRVSF